MTQSQHTSRFSALSMALVAVLALVVGIALGWLFFHSPAGETPSSTTQPRESNVASSVTPAIPLEEDDYPTSAASDDNVGLAVGADSAPDDTDESQFSGQDAQVSLSEPQAFPSESTASDPTSVLIDENGMYTSKDDVALYIHTYGHLPPNYISKTKARKAGWVASEGNLADVLPGMSIGGSEFYNDEGRLPDAAGRTWTECDINYTGGYRGAQRIVFSNDGLIFYTGDHYETFEQLY